jgi:hypothetical protein
MTIDHILSLSRGGKSNWANTACACRACNQYKGDRTPAEARLRLCWTLKAPRLTFWELSGEIPAAWKIYLRPEVSDGHSSYPGDDPSLPILS